MAEFLELTWLDMLLWMTAWAAVVVAAFAALMFVFRQIKLDIVQ